jgi:hypothetical protein
MIDVTNVAELHELEPDSAVAARMASMASNAC